MDNIQTEIQKTISLRSFFVFLFVPTHFHTYVQIPTSGEGEEENTEEEEWVDVDGNAFDLFEVDED